MGRRVIEYIRSPDIQPVLSHEVEREIQPQRALGDATDAVILRVPARSSVFLVSVPDFTMSYNGLDPRFNVDQRFDFALATASERAQMLQQAGLALPGMQMPQPMTAGHRVHAPMPQRASARMLRRARDVIWLTRFGRCVVSHPGPSRPCGSGQRGPCVLAGRCVAARMVLTKIADMITHDS
jgi:hypothetical protein